MDLKIEANIIIFDMMQDSAVFHPLTCSGGGGKCPNVILKARQVVGNKIEAYCTECEIHTQSIEMRDEQDKDYIYLYTKLVKIHRDGKIENIINK